MKPRAVLDAVCLEIERHGEPNRLQRRLIQRHNLVVVLAGLAVLDEVSEAPELVPVQNGIGRAAHLGKEGARLEARRDVQLGAVEPSDLKGMPLMDE